MPIQVVCPGCKKRFSVSDKFAGKQGPCPDCKTLIKIPAAAPEVVIHAPDEAGPGGKGGGGRPVFKPIRRTYWSLSPVMMMSVFGGVAVTFLAAVFIGAATDAVPMAIKALGAVVLAPPLVLGGYLFLRDPELATYRGTSLYWRVGVCALIYAAVWGLYAILRPLWFGPEPHFELYHYAIVLAAMVAAGAVGPFATLEFEYGTGALHYGFYLAVTILLLAVMGEPLL
ncbi:MAG: hypothetical protein KDA41_14640 [Planctomycetales bacterium]|nr:hypothetical protein [Planctomycetales bacterium]